MIVYLARYTQCKIAWWQVVRDGAEGMLLVVVVFLEAQEECHLDAVGGVEGAVSPPCYIL